MRLRTTSRVLQVTFDDGQVFELPFEYLRVHSPSAEVKGHGPGQEVLVTGKSGVGIRAIEPVGQYAVKLVFDDGHDTGLFTWKYLYEMGRDQASNWAALPGASCRINSCGRERRRRIKKGRAVKPGPGIQDPRYIFCPGLKPGKRGESCSRVWADCNTPDANLHRDLTNQRLT